MRMYDYCAKCIERRWMTCSGLIPMTDGRDVIRRRCHTCGTETFVPMTLPRILGG